MMTDDIIPNTHNVNEKRNNLWHHERFGSQDIPKPFHLALNLSTNCNNVALWSLSFRSRRTETTILVWSEQQVIQINVGT